MTESFRRWGTIAAATVVAAVAVVWSLASGRTAFHQPPEQRAASPAQERPLMSGFSFGERWTLSLRKPTGECVEIAESQSRSTICGRPRRGSLAVGQTDVGTGTLLFGLAPSEADRVWAALFDGRTVGGRLLAVRPPGSDVSLFVIPLSDRISAAVVATGAGRLVAAGTFSVSGEAARPTPVLDAYGNVIAFVPIGDWAVPEPGAAAAAGMVRAFASVPLRQVRTDLRAWWVDRPPPQAPAASFRSWWRSYPLGETLANPSLSVGSWTPGAI